ncbi:MAG: thioredoxin family protein [Clostridiales bacterium]|nr:thioredoxin family protein [Clostridiales bacterium]
MKYYVLGGGCAKCNTLTDNLKKALDELKIDAEITHVTDTVKIMSMGVMSTPALAIGDKVVSKGKVLSTKEIKKLIDENRNV